jgi:hypothetical protein
MLQGASQRWERHRHEGISDEALLDALRYEWGLGCGQSGPSFRQSHAIGGAYPRFWYGCDHHDKPTLEGKRLLEAVRRVMKLPHPGCAFVEQGSLFD